MHAVSIPPFQSACPMSVACINNGNCHTCDPQTYLPLDLRPKRTRALRRALSKEQVRNSGNAMREILLGVTLMTHVHGLCDVHGWGNTDE